jgi:hypothetical protein
MDGQKFDELIKQFCTTRLTRWSALRGLVAGVATTVTGSALLSEDAEAKKGRGARAENKKDGGGKDEHKGRGAQAEGKGGKKGGGKKSGGKKGAKKKGGQGGNAGTSQGGGEKSRVASQVACSTPSNSQTVTGNVSCPGGEDLKDDTPPAANECSTITDPCGCTIRYCVGADGRSVSFGPAPGEPACTVSQVIVKGGPDSQVYTFNGGAQCAAGLLPPANCGSQRNQQCGLSHIEFCAECCVPKTCEDLGVCGEDLDDQCNGTIDCACPVDCPAGTTLGENTVCTGGDCVCTPDTCESLGVCGTDLDDGCCGTIDCGCPDNCPAGTTLGENTVCDGGDCVCTPDTCASLGKTCGVHDNGCCGTVDCGTCFEGCTPGYFKNHPETFAQAGLSTNQTISSIFAIPSCLSGCNLGGKTLLQALSFKGGTNLCGAAEILLRAAVASLLNSRLVDFQLSDAEVIAEVNAALASCTRSTIITEATRLDQFNNSKDENGNHNCPCNNQGCPS